LLEKQVQAMYGHFGQGCVHTRIDFDLETADGIRKFREFIHAAARLVTRLGGSISGEHGDGQSKAELLPIMYGDQMMQAFREFKAIWDPVNRMNPGKVIDAHRADENLRLGVAYDPPRVATQFAYGSDNNDFARALLRCVGVGECRGKTGVMCPSYMATGEEMHSTRGRARLLFEMLRGETSTGGWEGRPSGGARSVLSCKAARATAGHVNMAPSRRVPVALTRTSEAGGGLRVRNDRRGRGSPRRAPRSRIILAARTVRPRSRNAMDRPQSSLPASRRKPSAYFQNRAGGMR